MMEKKQWWFFGILVFLIGISAYFFIFRFRIGKKPELTSESREVPVPTKAANETIARKVEELPPEERTKPHFEKFNFQGEINIREYGTVKEIIEQGKTYRLVLDFRGKVTVSLDKATYIGRAWFGYNKEGVMTKTEYTPISKEALDKVRIDQKVAVRYKEEDLVANKDLPILEFVLLE